MNIPTRPMELMLAGWQKTHTGGSKVTFWINDEDLEYFERATVRKGKIAGQRYQAVLVQLVDGSEEPDHESVRVPVKVENGKATTPTITLHGGGGSGGSAEGRPHFPAGLCGLAVKWCNDPHFHAWLESAYPAAWAASGENAAVFINERCGIASRKELDTNPAAKERFQTDILVPYATARKEDGVDE